MKLKIIRSVPPDVRYPDADTGRLDSGNKQASEPIRVLPVGIEVKPVTESDLEYIRKVLMYVCFRYRPAARQPQMIDTGMSHIGFRCVARTNSLTTPTSTPPGSNFTARICWSVRRRWR